MVASKYIQHRDTMLIMAARFLEAEYGAEALEVLAQWKDDRNKERWRETAETTGRSDPEYLFNLFNEEVHDFEVVRKSPRVLEVKVSRCLHEETFRRFNATEIGMRMICMGDHAVVEGFNPRINFRRPKTLMAGDAHCHFIFELEKMTQIPKPLTPRSKKRSKVF